MSVAICAVILAAGEGTRLRPLTTATPKALCPVGNIALLDRAFTRLARHRLSGPALVAVNACYLADQVAHFVGGRAYLSVEPGPKPLGTAGALGHLRSWIAGRPVLVTNSDAYLAPRLPDSADLAGLLSGWDGRCVRILGVAPRPGTRPEFGAFRFAGACLIPGTVAAELTPTYADLVREVWRPAEAAGRLEVIPYDGVYYDTGTPADYLAANLHAAGGANLVAADATIFPAAGASIDDHDNIRVRQSVIGSGARVHGRLTRCVVWPGGYVGPQEDLVDAVRVGRDLTVPVGLSS